jgi:hypothetical protein
LMQFGAQAFQEEEAHNRQRFIQSRYRSQYGRHGFHGYFTERTGRFRDICGRVRAHLRHTQHDDKVVPRLVSDRPRVASQAGLIDKHLINPEFITDRAGEGELPARKGRAPNAQEISDLRD